MDDIVVIILTLLVVVVGVINQFRKKQKLPLPEEAPEKGTSGLNFWEELLEVEKNEVPLNFEPYYDDTDKVEEPVKVASEPIISPAEKEGVHVIKKNFFEDMLKNSEIGTKEKGTNLPEGFSLRNAIIFSEIINPKYF